LVCTLTINVDLLEELIAVVAADLLDLARDTGALREGMIVLADKGLAGPRRA
jgi:hypothetical protein